MSSVNCVRSVEIAVSDLSRSAKFYSDAWALEPVGESPGVMHLRASGPENHVLTLRAASEPALASIEFGLVTIHGVDELYSRLAARGADISPPRELADPGGGYGFSMRDQSGRHWRFSAGVEVHERSSASADRPYKMSHVVLNSADLAEDVRFAVEDLGFRVRDESASMVFLGCNADHHSLAFARHVKAGLNHIAFEVPSIDAVMRNAGRLKKHGVRMEWGVGRHGPGANVYSYYLDPDEIPIEYTAELLQVDDATTDQGRRPTGSDRSSSTHGG